MEVKDRLRLEKMVGDLEAMTKFPVFGIDIGKDEVDRNPSFFICYPNGALSRGDGHNLIRELGLIFATKENAEIDEIAIIKKSPTWGLQFERTDYDYGKLGATQIVYQITTFYFHRPIGMGDCYGDGI